MDLQRHREKNRKKKKHIEVISRCFYCTRHTAKRFLLEATVNCSNLYWFSGDPNSPSITRMPQFHDTYCVKYMCSCTTCGSNSELKHSCSYLLSVFLVSARYLLPLLYANCLSILRQSWHTWSFFFPPSFPSQATLSYISIIFTSPCTIWINIFIYLFIFVLPRILWRVLGYSRL